MKQDIQDQLSRLESASPLEIPNILADIELLDCKHTQDVIDSINKELEEEDGVDNQLIRPMFMSVVDGILDAPIFKGISSKLGLSSAQVVEECADFSYDKIDSSLDYAFYDIIDSDMDYRAERAHVREFVKETRPVYKRSLYQDSSKMTDYKKRKIHENGQGKNIEDEYRLTKDITPKKKDGDHRRKDPKSLYNAEADHIVPLKQLYLQMRGNIALSDDDIKRIANQDDNLAVTARMINNPKRDKSNEEFIREQEEKKKEGKADVELNDSQKENMKSMGQKAQKKIESSINPTVFANLTGQGIADSKERNAAYKKAREEKGSKRLSKEEKEAIDRRLAISKTAGIYKEVGKNAAKQTGLRLIGRVLLFTIKPIYFEVSDGLYNGFKEGVGATSLIEAIKFRATRIRNYVFAKLEKWKDILLQSVWDVVKGLISCIAESIISMFVGLLKQILRVAKEGVKLATRTIEILRSKNATAREKGDAITKVLGGGLIALVGIGIDTLLEKCGVPEALHLPLTTILTGMSSAFLFYLLSKADFFNVKMERRHKRIIEIYDERIKELKDSTHTMNTIVLETLRKNRLQFASISDSFSVNIDEMNIRGLRECVYEYANLLNVEIPYKKGEFAAYIDSQEVLLL